MRLLLILVFVALVPGLWRVLVDVVLLALADGALAGRLLGGLGIGAVAHLLVLRRIPGFLTLQHELKHAIVAVLFLRRIHRFRVTLRSGGVLEYGQGFGGTLGNHIISLAPYFLLPTTVLATLILPVLPLRGWHAILFGALLAVDLIDVAHDLRRNWSKDSVPMVDGSMARTDIGQRGYLFTAATVAFWGLALLVLSLGLVTTGYEGMPAVGAAVVETWRDTGVWIWRQVGELRSQG